MLPKCSSSLTTASFSIRDKLTYLFRYSFDHRKNWFRHLPARKQKLRWKFNEKSKCKYRTVRVFNYKASIESYIEEITSISIKITSIGNLNLIYIWHSINFCRFCWNWIVFGTKIGCVGQNIEINTSVFISFSFVQQTRIANVRLWYSMDLVSALQIHVLISLIVGPSHGINNRCTPILLFKMSDFPPI